MVATSGSARLVPTTDLLDSSAVTATLSRAEIEEALSDGEGAPQLSLQVVQTADGGESRRELGIDWERSDLERVLESTTAETVTLAFARHDLESALVDVEAHGMRERAAIFTVAVAAVQIAPDIVSDAGSGGGLVQTSASDSLVSDAGSGGGLVQTSASDSLVSDAGSGGGLVQPTGADAMITDAGSSGPMPIVDDNSGGSSFSVPTPDPAMTGMVAGMGLLIAGAAFTMRRRDTHRPV